MATRLKPLPLHPISPTAQIHSMQQSPPQHVTLNDSALAVMTDLTRTMAFTIGPMANILLANDRMMACGVRSLFVTDAEGNILGLISASDILGEKPVQYLKAHGGNRDEILVQDIMVNRAQLNVLSRADVERASVSDIVDTMNFLGRQHALVVENDGNGQEIVCGMFSTTQIGRQLDMVLEPMFRATTFADVEMAVLSK